MLAELRIRDFAIIDELDLTLGPGFCVLTGETGAGKSIIIDAVGLVLGGRADSAVVRAGADRSLIEAAFRLQPDHAATLAPLLSSEGLEGDDSDLLLVGREVRRNGRNVCRLNGRAVSLHLLRQVAQGLVDIHGQTEHLSLLHVGEQLTLLDRYADALALRKVVSQLVARLREVRRELEDLLAREQEMAQRADLLEFQIREIELAALVPGEEEDLLAERVRLANAEKLATLVGEALRALEEGSDDGPSAVDLVGTAGQALTALGRVDATLGPQVEASETISYQIEELAGDLRAYGDRIEINPQRLRVVEDRLGLIRQMKRKYGSTVDDVLVYARSAAVELERIAGSDDRAAELREDEHRLLNEVGQKAHALSVQRREAAQRLAVGIEEELGDLRMEGSRFGVAFQWREDSAGVAMPNLPDDLVCVVTSDDGEQPECAGTEDRGPRSVAFEASGVDRAEFVVSPNPGEPLKPVNKIASGGETSRLMLAVKAVLSRADQTPTLIFDEIDQGIGGRVGATVGEKLWGLSTAPEPGNVQRQVLCVTHLPQLAGFGDVHLHVEKRVLGERTVTRVRALNGPSRVAEMAQMMGAGSTAGYSSAEQLLEDIVDRKRRARVTRPDPRDP